MHDHHFSKVARPLTTEEAARIKEMGFNNPVGTTHHMEGFIRYKPTCTITMVGLDPELKLTECMYTSQTNSHSAQRALLRSLDHANNAQHEESVEMARLMAEFDALVQEFGAIKVRGFGILVLWLTDRPAIFKTINPDVNEPPPTLPPPYTTGPSKSR